MLDMQEMAVYLTVHGTNKTKSFLRVGTLAAPASFWGHVGGTIDVLLDDGTFSAASVTTPLLDLLKADTGVAGEGNMISPICIYVSTGKCTWDVVVVFNRYVPPAAPSSYPSWLCCRSGYRG